MITVGMPLYRAKNVAFFALESLCRQRHATEWELIVAEETHPDSVGEKYIQDYAPRLENAGCKQIKYLSLKKWIPLGDKWIKMGKIASGDIFLLQSADCYSYSERIKDTYNSYLKTNFDWFGYCSHNIFNLYDMTLYNFYVKNDSTGADMAISTQSLKKITKKHRWKGVDSWLLQELLHINNNAKICLFNNIKSVKKGSINIHGLNNLSNRKFDRNGYSKSDYKLEKFLPKEIITELEKRTSLLNSYKLLNFGDSRFIQSRQSLYSQGLSQKRVIRELTALEKLRKSREKPSQLYNIQELQKRYLKQPKF